MRISRFLNPTTWLVGQLFCLQAASAQTITEQRVETMPSGFTPILSTSYLRSAADEDSAYYQSIFAAEADLRYTLPDSALLRLRTGISRDLDALEERNVWSSTSLAYLSRKLEIGNDLIFQYSGTVTAPTNSDMRDYLSYRGSLGLGARVARSWKALPVGKSLSLGLSGSGTRNFFEYDATKAGWPNTVIALSTAVSAAFEINDMFELSADYELKKPKKSNGTWVDTIYEHSIAAGVNLSKQLSVSVSESTENRAYSYDAQTAQFALYDYQTTMYELAATYTF